MNPEFRRLVQIEFQGYRLVALPAVLGGAFFIAYLLNGREFDSGTAFIAVLAYFALVFIWGTRQAAETVLQEINANTWDPQRMSALSAWDMAWAKLFGATALTWVGGAACLAVYVVSNIGLWGWRQTLIAVFLYAGTGLLAQATCFLISLAAIQRRREFGRVQMVSYQFLGMLAALPPLYIGLSVSGGEGLMDLLIWYGRYFTLAQFMVVSVAVFAAWALAGSWALMRAELQEPLTPWLWALFTVFVMAFFGGIKTLPVGPNLALALVEVPSLPEMVLGAGLMLVYVMVMLEPKNRVRLRRLADHIDAARWSSASTLAPRSVVTLAVTGFGVIAATIWFGDYPPQRAPALHSGLAAGMLFALRDVVFIYWVVLGRRDGRGEGLAGILLILSYAAVFGIPDDTFLTPLAALLGPSGNTPHWWTIAAPALEAMAFLWLLRRRWQRAAAAPGGTR